MGTMTINVDDETLNLFRDAVKKEVGEGKGKLGAAVKESFEMWVQKKKNEEIAQRQIAMMKKGYHLGGYVFRREDAYER